MTFASRSLALVAFVSAVSGFAVGEFPTRTVGYGDPLEHEPTEAPSVELVKKSLERRALTNTCTEWTIPGGYGQPYCSNSETCLFTTDTYGSLWEGCGETSISYDWITACYNYPQSGVPPVSEIYCDASAPFCGYLAFEFDSLRTFYNLGCSQVAYSYFVDLLSTTSKGSSSQTLILAGGGTTSLTVTAAATDIATETGTPTTVPPAIATGLGDGSTTSQPTPAPPASTVVPHVGSHKAKKKTPIGAIVGGVIGGLAVLALLAIAALLAMRKRRQSRAATQTQQPQVQQQPDSAAAGAFQNNNHISEAGGAVKPGSEYAGAFVPQQQGKADGGEKLMGQHVTEYSTPGQQSPPPVYAQPNAQAQEQQNSQFQHQSIASSYPPSNYTELDNQSLQPGNARASVPPVSPVGTYTSNATDVVSSNTGTYQPSITPAASPPPTHALPNDVHEMSGSTYQQFSSPPVVQQVNQPPPNVQEMSGNETFQQQPAAQPPTSIQEMSGNAASIRPPRQNAGFDMSGAPMSEGFGHHEMP